MANKITLSDTSADADPDGVWEQESPLRDRWREHVRGDKGGVAFRAVYATPADMLNHYATVKFPDGTLPAHGELCLREIFPCRRPVRSPLELSNDPKAIIFKAGDMERRLILYQRFAVPAGDGSEVFFVETVAAVDWNLIGQQEADDLFAAVEKKVAEKFDEVKRRPGAKIKGVKAEGRQCRIRHYPDGTETGGFSCVFGCTLAGDDFARARCCRYNLRSDERKVTFASKEEDEKMAGLLSPALSLVEGVLHSIGPITHLLMSSSLSMSCRLLDKSTVFSYLSVNTDEALGPHRDARDLPDGVAAVLTLANPETETAAAHGRKGKGGMGGKAQGHVIHNFCLSPDGENGIVLATGPGSLLLEPAASIIHGNTGLFRTSTPVSRDRIALVFGVHRGLHLPCHGRPAAEMEGFETAVKDMSASLRHIKTMRDHTLGREILLRICESFDEFQQATSKHLPSEEGKFK